MVSAQSGFQSECELIHSIDQLIHDIDVNDGEWSSISVPSGVDPTVMAGIIEVDSVFSKEDSANIAINKRITVKGQSILKVTKNILAPQLKIGSPEFNLTTFRSSLDCIKNVETITWLELVIQLKIDEYEISNVSNINQTVTTLEDALEITRAKVNKLIERDFTFYGFTSSTSKWVKGIYLDHTNDFLGFFGSNDDRDLTGAFRLELFTDQFKMRLLSGYSDKMYNVNGRNWYSYQSIFFGGEGYTPYLRDTTIFADANSIDTNDRPFASFVYVGRSKHRITRLGRYRSHSQLKIGTIGSNKPGSVQAVIHRDIMVASKNPNGWGSQIASGGRLAFSYDLVGEFLINPKGKWMNWSKWSVLGHGVVGYDKTAAGAGLAWSNKNLKDRGGIDIAMNKDRTKTWYHFFMNNMTLTATAKYQYIFHNSMLEGYGIFNHAVDENALSPIDAHFLTDDQMVRNIFSADFSINIRLKYVGLIFRQSIMSPEYDLPVNSIEYPYGASNGVGPSNHNLSLWNHYGTIGLLFLVK